MPLSDFYPDLKGWTPVTPSAPSAPPSNSSSSGPSQLPPSSDTPSSPYLRTSLPLPLQYSPDTLRQSNRPGLSGFRIAPLPPGGVAAINAASTSVVNNSITEFAASSGAAGPNGSVQFNNAGPLGGVSQFNWNNATSTLGITGSLTLSTPLGVTYGGTGSNLSATGGANEVVQQSTVGGPFTVGQLSFTNISGILSVASGGTGTATPALVAGMDITITGPWPDQTVAVKTQAGVTPGSYINSNITVDSSGIITAISSGSGATGSTVAAVNAVVQSAAISTTPLYTVPASPAGGSNFMLSWNAKTTTAAGSTSTLGPLQLTFTSPDGVTFTAQNLQYTIWPGGVAIDLSGNTFNTTTDLSMGIPILINVQAGSTISYAFGYASSGVPSMVYDLHVRLVLV